jgi:putative peptide zinc metalloprotease protein
VSGHSGHPLVRPGLRYIRQEKDGKPTYIVKDPVALKYFRFGTLEVWLMQRMDGTSSCYQLADDLRAEFGLNASADAIATLVRRLKELGLAQRDSHERSAILVESLRRQRRVRLQANNNTLLRMRFSFGDPDRLLDRLVHHLSFAWTPGFVVISGIVFAMYAVVLAGHWAPFTAGLGELYNPANFTPALLGSIYLVGTVIFLIHEFGHGLTCKRFGGEVHEMGAMLFYFSPAFFCNVNDAWMFEKRAHRLWVTFAGGWIQLLVAAVAGFIWISTEPGTLVHRVAFLSTLLGGGLSILINFNPLIPLDGYYAAVDWLDMPNLRPRAFATLGALLKRHVLRLDTPVPPAIARERRILLTYGVLASAYTALILTVVLVYVGRLLVTHLGGWGWTLFGLLVWRVTRGPRHALARTARVWWTDSRVSIRTRRIAVAAAGGVVLSAALLLLVPWTIRAPALIMVEPAERAWLRAPERAQLVAVHAFEGDRVEAGDAIAVLRDERLDIALRAARAEVTRLEASRAGAQAGRDAATERTVTIALEAARGRARELVRRRDALTLRAPFPAVVATPRLEERIGAQIPSGSAVAELWGEHGVRGRVMVAQRDAGDVRTGTALAIRFAAFPAWTWRTQVAHVEGETSRSGHIEATAFLPLDPAAPALRPGMTGSGKMVVARSTLAGALVRSVRRHIRLDLLL